MHHATLRKLMGLGDAPAPLRDSTLLMIECQNTYRTGTLELPGAEPALSHAARLLSWARETAVPVVHLLQDGGPGSLYDVRTETGRISKEVAPIEGEEVVVKSLASAFAGTGLDDLIRRGSCRDLILVGFMTHLAVSSTARDAFRLGYRSTVVADATATRDLTGPDGTVIPARTVHDTSLAALGDLFSIVVLAPDDIPV
ncbi:isochorismatase family protein [Streptomyces sp. NPDC005526]|uniref:isochorismatase family protein n=1 Tax=unclassified Streptomyces TaxID=2593676 RepID=UPI0033AF3833